MLCMYIWMHDVCIPGKPTRRVGAGVPKPASGVSASTGGDFLLIRVGSSVALPLEGSSFLDVGD